MPDGNAEGAGEIGAASFRACTPALGEWTAAGLAGLENAGFGLGVGLRHVEDV